MTQSPQFTVSAKSENSGFSLAEEVGSNNPVSDVSQHKERCMDQGHFDTFQKLTKLSLDQCESPIEEIVAKKIMFKAGLTPITAEEFNNGTVCGRFYIQQYRVGPYVADFMIVQRVRTSKDTDLNHKYRESFFAIECDGHDFHERTKDQAQHDRARDRYFQRKGVYVLRFTGSEIHNFANDVADEIGDFACSGVWQ